MLSTTMDMRRQIIDMLHPMYDIMVSASASVDYHKNDTLYDYKWYLFTCSGSCLGDTNTAKLVR